MPTFAKANEWTPIGPWEIESNKGGLSVLTVSVVTMDPTTSTTLYVAISDGPGIASYEDLFKTTDGGRSWQKLQNPLEHGLAGVGELTSIIVDPHNPKILYINDGNDISKSTDGGRTWTYIGPHFVITPPPRGASFVRLGSLVLVPTAPEILYALPDDYGGVYKSTDGGNHWTAINKEFEFSGLFVDPTSSTTVYATYGKRFFKSTDGGQTWQNRSTVSKGGIQTLAI
ncbi:MAG: hypothetical protein VSS75_019155, partial [Candidatus Parabeggiatoa sp.]|nr:hypothetical protein [Candidatus Parabeggiatoa sp.]